MSGRRQYGETMRDKRARWEAAGDVTRPQGRGCPSQRATSGRDGKPPATAGTAGRRVRIVSRTERHRSAVLDAGGDGARGRLVPGAASARRRRSR